MAVATTGFPYDQEDAGPQDPPTKKLNEPVMLDATGRTRLSVVDAGGAGALQTYMTLPGAVSRACLSSSLALVSGHTDAARAAHEASRTRRARWHAHVGAINAAAPAMRAEATRCLLISPLNDRSGAIHASRGGEHREAGALSPHDSDHSAAVERAVDTGASGSQSHPRIVTSRQGGDLFRITIPRMKFFSVWIEPMVEVTVRITPDEVRRGTATLALRGLIAALPTPPQPSPESLAEPEPISSILAWQLCSAEQPLTRRRASKRPRWSRCPLAFRHTLSSPPTSLSGEGCVRAHVRVRLEVRREDQDEREVRHVLGHAPQLGKGGEGRAASFR